MSLPQASPFYRLTSSCLADPDRSRYLFIDDQANTLEMTGRELVYRSLAFASGLSTATSPGERVLLPYPPGLGFIVGFLGCLAAGRIPVPANYPKPRHPASRYQRIADDCQATLAVTLEKTQRTLTPSADSALQWCSAEEIEATGRRQLLPSLTEADADLAVEVFRQLEQFSADRNRQQLASTSPRIEIPEDLLFLQYTSGSTSSPKGVMVTAENLFANLATINHGFGLDQMSPQRRVVCSWLPAYHDMGLVGVILSTLFSDAEAILMSPTSFLRRPTMWLEAISSYRATITVAPCFGYQWAAHRISRTDAEPLDLSHLQLAACGAEPISPDVLRDFASRFRESGFSESSFYPCYGLAEATLMVSGEPRGAVRPSIDARTKQVSQHFEREALRSNCAIATNHSEHAIEIVSCGPSGLETEVAIACQKTGQRLSEGEIGEIVVRSAGIAAGYWNAPESTDRTFGFGFEGEAEANYLRTGDLGFLFDGQLFITGRRKELIIVAGQNFYPHDIEQSASQAHACLAGLPSAGFAIPGDGTERLVVVHEVPRGIDDATLDQAIRKIRLAVASAHDLAPACVVAVRTASIPRTSSGKVQRLQTSQQYLRGELKVVRAWELGRLSDHQLFKDIGPLLKTGNAARVRIRIENTLLRWIAVHTGESPEFVKPDSAFAEMGVDSLLSVQLAQEFEQWLGCRISPVAAWSSPTPSKMADYLLGLLDLDKTAGHSDDEEQQTLAADFTQQDNPALDLLSGDLESLLDELEQLDEEQAQSMLNNL